MSEREFESFPDGWSDGAIISSIIRNRDGSITAKVDVEVIADDGTRWRAFRTIRLEKEKRQERG